MACGHIGERNELPCLRRETNHVGKHRYKYRAPRPQSDRKEQSVLVPAPRLPASALMALERYSELAKPGETMYAGIMERLRSMK